MSRSTAPIAIIGVGCRFPQADDAAQYWRNISESRACFTDIPRDRWDHRTFFNANQREIDKAWTASGGFINGFKKFPALHFGIAPRRLEVMDPQQRLLIEATRVALMDAGYDDRPFNREKTGVFMGVSVAEFKNIALARVSAMQIAGGEFGPPAATQALRDALMEMTENVVPTRAFSLAGALTALAATSVSQVFDLGGPSYTLDAACASASVAINDAVLQLRAGLIDCALAGGAYINLTPDNLISFTRIGAISPTGACRPFDEKADGFVQGDGVGVIFLKRLDDALRDGDRVLALIRGTGCNNDGRGEGPMTPRVSGQLRALHAAYGDADFSPATVAFFEAHGTATSVGDPVEIEALGTLLKSAGVDAPALIGSVKGVIGHAMSAAGIAGVIKAVKMIEHRVAPAQPNFTRPNASLKLEQHPLEVCAATRALEGRAGGPLRVGVSSFGFGGTNSHIVLEEAPERSRPRGARRAAAAPLPEAVVVTAPNFALLDAHLGTLIEVARREDGSLADFAFTLNARRKKERVRAVIGARTFADFVENALRARAALASAPSAKIPAEGRAATISAGPHAAIYDSGPADAAPLKVAFLFPGQGAQRLDLFAGLRGRFSGFADSLRRLSGSVAGILPRPLTDYIYPAAGADRAVAEAELTQTEVCQPAMAALSLSLAELLGSAGVRADVSLGHSLGEFTALAHGGALSAEEAVRLVAIRGGAMRDLALPDPGTMAAVMSDAATVRAAIAGIEGVWVANINHPRQVSISGTHAGVLAASEALAARGLEVKPLSVSHAFHTPLLSGIALRMEEALAKVEYSTPAHAVCSCIVADRYSADAKSARETLVLHATSAVDFVRALEAARAAGATVFVHLGAGGTLSGFARATLGDVAVVNMAAVEDDGGYELVRGLATLCALGVAVDFDAVYAGEGRGLVGLPETPLEREEYWPVKEQKSPRPRMDQPLPAAGVSLDSLGAKMTTKNDGSAALVELFRAQAEILAKHAEIIAAQNRVLAGGGAAAQEVAAPATSFAAQFEQAFAKPLSTSTAPAAAPVPQANVEQRVRAELAEVAPAVDTSKVRERVFEIVAKISAFPRDSLRGEQRLVDELGFDSLMVADLGGAVQNAFPAAGGLPQSLFSLQTTVADIAEHISRTLGKGPQAPAKTEEKKVLAPVSRYRPVLRARPRRGLSAIELSGTTWLAVEQKDLLARALEKRGARVVRVQLTKHGVAAHDRINAGTQNLWPESFAEGLSRAIAASNIALDGIVCADLSGVDTLHALVAGSDVKHIAVVTALGGKLGLEPSPALEQNLLQAGLAGYAKSLARERPNAVIRAIDVDPAADAEANAEAIASELASGDLALEVGLQGGQRWFAELAPVNTSSTAPAREIKTTDVVLITGGTGELGSLIAAAIAQKKPKKIILTGTKKPDEKIAALLAKLQKFGPKADYVAGDVAVLSSMPEVTIAIHAAGKIEDGPAAKKSAETIASVMSPKIFGARAILRACPNLTDLILFSSWAGWFGNAGQTDYAAANEILDRTAIASASNAVRVLSLVWPPWSNTAMVRSIPAMIRDAMAAEGVTFLDDAEGLETFFAAFSAGTRGMELIGRALPEREYRGVHVEKFGDETHPYLKDHSFGGRAVVPLASAADLIAFAAGDAKVIENLELVRGLFGGEVATVKILGTNAEIRTGDNQVAYRAKLSRSERAIAPLSISGEDEPLNLSLDAFYRDHTFHGPMLRGIEKIERMTAQGIAGVVKTSSPKEWMPKSPRAAWTIDPRLVDGSFQLAAYWAEVHLGKAGYPIGFERLTMLRPFGQEPLRATLVLAKAGEEGFTGSIFWSDLSGKPVALLENVRARFAEVVKTKAPPAAQNGNGNGHGHSAGAKPAETPIEVPVENYDIAQFPEVELLDQRFQMAELIGLRNPYFHVHAGTAKNRSVVDGVEMINFSSYNYLGFSGHPEVVAAAQEAIEKYGTSVSASRVASGERPIHRQLEEGIAQHIGVDDSIVFVSGHATNVTTIGHLLDKDDLVLHDSLIHDSIMQGVFLSGATRRPFPHNDFDALERTLSQIRKNYRRVLITAEGIYSMDGDTCDLPRLIELKKKYRALLMIDEAHSIGVLGPQGRGIGHHYGSRVNPRDVDIWMGTLSKSFASCGGYIAGNHALVRYLKYTAPGFVYSAGITPPNAAAAIKSLELMQKQPETVERLRARSKFFLDLARSKGIDCGQAIGAAVIPAIIGNSLVCMKLSARLAERGINVQPIVYPAVEDDAARLRFFLSSTHTEEELRQTVDILVEELARVRAETAAETTASI